MVEPAIEFGTAGVVAERGSAEQEQDQDNPHRRASLLSYLLRGHSVRNSQQVWA
jgi:hypothetical protein